MPLTQNRPTHLTTDINTIPDTPGVYLLYGSNTNTPLYIGKSIHMRQRILSHLYNAKRDKKSYKIFTQLHRIESIETAGELGALLLESQLIKTHMPVFNRRLRRVKKLAGLVVTTSKGYYHLSTAYFNEDELTEHPEIYGAFKSKKQAESTVLQLVRTHRLCPKLCQLEKMSGPCFSLQLKRCFGACIQQETSDAYNQRVMSALNAFKNITWPFCGPIAIFEQCPLNDISAYHVMNHWRYLGSESLYENAVKQANTHSAHRMNIDEMKIIQSFIHRHPERCIPL